MPAHREYFLLIYIFFLLNQPVFLKPMASVAARYPDWAERPELTLGNCNRFDL